MSKYLHVHRTFILKVCDNFVSTAQCALLPKMDAVLIKEYSRAKENFIRQLHGIRNSETYGPI